MVTIYVMCLCGLRNSASFQCYLTFPSHDESFENKLMYQAVVAHAFDSSRGRLISVSLSQPGLQSDFRNRQDYTEKLSQKIRQSKSVNAFKSIVLNVKIYFMLIFMSLEIPFSKNKFF